MKQFEFQRQMNDQGWPMLLLRLIVGFGFVAHGWAKLSRGPEGFGDVLAAIGIPFPQFTAWLTTLLELIGGVFIMAGAFIPFISVPLIFIMLTAIFTVHFQYGFSSIKIKAFNHSGAEFGPAGYELSLVYIVALLVLSLAGAGRFSIDNWMRRRHLKEKL